MLNGVGYGNSSVNDQGSLPFSRVTGEKTGVRPNGLPENDERQQQVQWTA